VNCARSSFLRTLPLALRGKAQTIHGRWHFQPSNSYPASQLPTPLATGDFHRGGFLDLAASDSPDWVSSGKTGPAGRPAGMQTPCYQLRMKKLVVVQFDCHPERALLAK